MSQDDDRKSAGKPAVVAGAPRAAEVAARYSDAAETARRLSPEVVRALADAGFARHFVPVGHGGAAGGFAELVSAVAEVGKGCTAAAWAASLSAYAGRYAAFLPEQGQAEVWAQGPDALLAGALIPSGKAERVAGGWRLTGEWKYISGVHFADWVLACAAVPPDPLGAGPDAVPVVSAETPSDSDASDAVADPVPPARPEAASAARAALPPGGLGVAPPEVRFFAVPRRDFGIAQSWFTVGMRGTGSDTLLLTDVFVPEHRSFARAAVAAGRAPASGARCHTVPLHAGGVLRRAAPLIGAARGALCAWTARTGLRVDVRGRAVGARPSVQVALARSAGEVDAAELLILRSAAVADGTQRLAGDEAAVRGPRDTALAVELLVSAVDRVFRASGTSGQSTSDPVQRFWRDVNSAATHVALSFESCGAAYGAWALTGEEPSGGGRNDAPTDRRTGGRR
jgi:alkylation response protein AidB-like acyl-CoA dehydrogenase